MRILESAAASLAAEPETDISEIESVYEEAEEALKEGKFKAIYRSEPCISS